MKREDTLREKVAAFTTRSDGRSIEEPGPDEIVVVFPGGDLAHGFDVARAKHGPVRLVGPGATLQRGWPAWAHDARDLWLTEITALKCEPVAVASRELEGAITSWLDSILGDALGRIPSGQALFSQACARVFQPLVLAYPIVRGLVDAFPNARLHCADERSVYADILTSLSEDRSIRVTPASARLSSWKKRTWRAETMVAGAAAFAAASVLHARELVWSRRSIRAIQERRRASTPTRWVALVGDWDRINRHLVDAFALPILRSGEPLGLLLVGSIREGQRVEADFRRPMGAELFAGLRSLGALVTDCEMDQAVMPETLGAVVAAWQRSATVAARASWRLGAARRVRLAGVSIDLGDQLWPLAKLIALDAMRAVFAQAATAALLARRDFSGTTVVFCATSSPELATNSIALQQAGATTVDHPHGAGGDTWTGAAWTESSVRCVWTLADARSVATRGQRLVLTGMPRRRAFAARGRPPRNLLVASNYVHRDSRIGERFPLRPFQQELLAVVDALRRAGHVDLAFRWRPHPADLDAPITEDLAAVAGLELSRGRALDEDAEWADVVITSHSTVVLELLLAELPVFVQPTPDLWGIPATDFIDPTRMFFYADDGATKISAALRAWRDGDTSWLAPERHARAALFGPAGEPIPMIEYFGANATLDPFVDPLRREAGSDVAAQPARARAAHS